MSWPAVHQQAHSPALVVMPLAWENPRLLPFHFLRTLLPSQELQLESRRAADGLPVSFSLPLKPGCALCRDRWDTGNAVFSYLQVRSSVCVLASGQKLHRASEILVWQACFLNEVLFQLLHSMVLSKSLASGPHFFILFIMSGREMLFAVQFSYNLSPNSFLLLLINMTLYFLLFVNSY